MSCQEVEPRRPRTRFTHCGALGPEKIPVSALRIMPPLTSPSRRVSLMFSMAPAYLTKLRLQLWKLLLLSYWFLWLLFILISFSLLCLVYLREATQEEQSLFPLTIWNFTVQDSSSTDWAPGEAEGWRRESPVVSQEAGRDREHTRAATNTLSRPTFQGQVPGYLKTSHCAHFLATIIWSSVHPASVNHYH